VYVTMHMHFVIYATHIHLHMHADNLWKKYTL